MWRWLRRFSHNECFGYVSKTCDAVIIMARIQERMREKCDQLLLFSCPPLVLLFLLKASLYESHLVVRLPTHRRANVAASITRIPPP